MRTEPSVPVLSCCVRVFRKNGGVPVSALEYTGRGDARYQDVAMLHFALSRFLVDLALETQDDVSTEEESE